MTAFRSLWAVAGLAALLALPPDFSANAAKPTGGGGGGTSGGTSAGQNVIFNIQFGGTTRTYIVHVPAGYDKRKSYPLVMVYHGKGGTGSGIEQKTGFDVIADAQGFFVAYRSGLDGDWKPTGANNDIDFTKVIIQNIEMKYSINSSHIYASGYSQGGNFAQILGCAMADWFAGFANVAGAMNATVASQCFPARPIAAMFFHGTADPVVPYNGGATLSGSTVYSQQQTVEFWAAANDCPDDSATTVQFADALSDGSTVTGSLETWSGCAAGTSIRLYTIENGGHTWPGSDTTINGGGSSEVGLTSTGVKASDLIWQILSPLALAPAS